MGLRANELRIGNFVFDDYSGVMEVASISDDYVSLRKNKRLPMGRYDNNNIEPIPLTEEWLVRFGFNCKYKSVHNHWSLGSFGIEQASDVDDDGGSIPQLEEFTYGFTYYPEIKYVHQLQNLYFALTGEELNPV